MGSPERHILLKAYWRSLGQPGQLNPHPSFRGFSVLYNVGSGASQATKTQVYFFEFYGLIDKSREDL